MCAQSAEWPKDINAQDINSKGHYRGFVLGFVVVDNIAAIKIKVPVENTIRLPLALIAVHHSYMQNDANKYIALLKNYDGFLFRERENKANGISKVPDREIVAVGHVAFTLSSSNIMHVCVMHNDGNREKEKSD